MTSPKAVCFLSDPQPVTPVSWKRHWVICGAVVAICLAIPINYYFAGLRFVGNIAFSLVLPFALSLIILIPLMIGGTIKGFYRIIRKQDSLRQAALLLLPYFALFGITLLPIPTFAEGVAASLRKQASNEDLVALARSIEKSPPHFMSDGQSKSLRDADQDWLAAHTIVERAGLTMCPMIQLGKDTVSFHAGRSIAGRWGISISTIPGSKPEIQQDALSAIPAYPDVWVFTWVD